MPDKTYKPGDEQPALKMLRNAKTIQNAGDTRGPMFGSWGGPQVDTWNSVWPLPEHPNSPIGIADRAGQARESGGPAAEEAVLGGSGGRLYKFFGSQYDPSPITHDINLPNPISNYGQSTDLLIANNRLPGKPLGSGVIDGLMKALDQRADQNNQFTGAGTRYNSPNYYGLKK